MFQSIIFVVAFFSLLPISEFFPSEPNFLSPPFKWLRNPENVLTLSTNLTFLISIFQSLVFRPSSECLIHEWPKWRRQSTRLNLRECCPFHCASPKWLQTRNLNTYRLICGSKDEHLLLFPQYSCVAAGIKSFFPWTIKKFELGNVAHFYIDSHYSLKAKIKVFQQDPYPNVT